jgi:hypothetical protein
VVASDTGTNPDPVPFWGSIDCATASRHQLVGSGGDTHLTATGSPQANTSYRRLTVIDGDDFWGERCELGENWTQPAGPTVFYHEGERRVTFASIRLGGGVNPLAGDWRTVLQMKQTNPQNNPFPGPVFELQVRSGVWMPVSSWQGIWQTPAQQNVWTRFAFDITYSSSPSIGSIKVYVDLNGDGDANDADEQSPVIHVATLLAETAPGGSSPYAFGESIPSHLRSGIYQNPLYSCPTGCSVDLDNVQVVRP